MTIKSYNVHGQTAQGRQSRPAGICVEIRCRLVLRDCIDSTTVTVDHDTRVDGAAIGQRVNDRQSTDREIAVEHAGRCRQGSDQMAPTSIERRSGNVGGGHPERPSDARRVTREIERAPTAGLPREGSNAASTRIAQILEDVRRAAHRELDAQRVLATFEAIDVPSAALLLQGWQ